ncbi:MAG: sensor histidine kinase [Burkholderiaceae bacterium]
MNRLNRLFQFFRIRSLAARTALVFAGLVTVIWLALVAWVVYDALAQGRIVAETGLRSYANQVLAVAERWPADDPALAEALAAVVSIENSPVEDGGNGDSDNFAIQIWRDGKLALGAQAGSGQPLEQHNQVVEFRSGQTERWGYVVRSAHKDVVVQLSLNAPTTSSIGWPSVAIFLMPLVLCLPLLLVPAWVMTRFGLKPLQTTTTQILARVDAGDLSPLPATRYKELNPLLEAMNKLMSRLSNQIDRERGFVADVAHEIKTPLAALAANIGTATSSADQSRQQAALDDLEPGLRRTTHLVQQLLGMARLDVEAAADSHRTLDLAEFIRERISLLFALAEARSIRLEAQLPERHQVTINPDQIGAIVDNVVGNAVKYSPQQGCIRIELRPALQGFGFELTVTDQGPGVPQADRERIFERFYRGNGVSQQTDGAGLGMAITKRAVDRLSGSIELSEPPGGGLCVTVKVPADVITS